jgi:hypothetical protein
MASDPRSFFQYLFYIYFVLNTYVLMNCECNVGRLHLVLPYVAITKIQYDSSTGSDCSTTNIHYVADCSIHVSGATYCCHLWPNGKYHKLSL